MQNVEGKSTYSHLMAALFALDRFSLFRIEDTYSLVLGETGDPDKVSDPG